MPDPAELFPENANNDNDSGDNDNAGGSDSPGEDMTAFQILDDAWEGVMHGGTIYPLSPPPPLALSLLSLSGSSLSPVTPLPWPLSPVTPLPWPLSPGHLPPPTQFVVI